MTNEEYVNKITEILKNFGESPQYGEPDYDAFPKLLKCIENMYTCIENMDNEIKTLRDQITSLERLIDSSNYYSKT